MKQIKFIGKDTNTFSERLLEDGFFPENMPPVFEITNFHEASIKPVIAGNIITDAPTEACRYNASKRGGQRRTFSMPNPIFMIDAAIFFLKYSEEIDEHLVPNSSSYPTFNETDGRPLKIHSYPEFHKRRREELASSRFIVRTDISRYYHSIYTHSLPWALHGKLAAKKIEKKIPQGFLAIYWII